MLLMCRAGGTVRALFGLLIFTELAPCKWLLLSAAVSIAHSFSVFMLSSSLLPNPSFNFYDYSFSLPFEDFLLSPSWLFYPPKLHSWLYRSGSSHLFLLILFLCFLFLLQGSRAAPCAPIAHLREHQELSLCWAHHNRADAGCTHVPSKLAEVLWGRKSFQRGT